jgi:hypothetical protein
MKLLKKLFSKRNKPEYAWIIAHHRSTDVVYFGPFYNYKQLNEFYSDPANKQIHRNLHLIILPGTSPDKYWYTNLNHLYASDSYLFE